MWPQLATGIGGIAIGLASLPHLVLGEEEARHALIGGPWGAPQDIFASGALILLAGIFGQLFISPSYGRLVKERDRAIALARERTLAVEDVLRGVLAQLCKRINLTGPEIRASLYCHDSDSFILLARFSTNPELAKPGRTSYPESQGVIAKTWQQGGFSVTDLPEDRTEWETQLGDYGFDAETAKTIRMQSRSLAGYRVDDLTRPQREPLGLIVIESELPRGVTPEIIDRINRNPILAVLTAAISNVEGHFPDVARTLHGHEETARHLPDG